MTDEDTSDFLRRAGYALRDMQGRVEGGKVEMFRECIKRLEALSAALEAKKATVKTLHGLDEISVETVQQLTAERDALKAELADAVVVLNALLKEASITNNRGAATGPHWTHLGMAILKTRAFIARHQRETGA